MILFFLALSVVLFYSMSRRAATFHNQVIEGLSRGIVITSFAAYLGFSLSLIGRNTRFEHTKAEYNYLKYIVENCEVKAEDQVESIYFYIEKDVMDMNNTISEHKAGSESFLFSLWYSAEIGELETIALKQH